MPPSPPPLPPLELLRGFEATARCRNFTHAAAELGLSQSAMSRQIQSLEQALGLPLFLRQPRQLSLTPAGEQLLLTVQDIFERLASTVSRLQQPGRQPVTISTTIGLAALWLVPRLSDFLQQHPEIDVRVSANNRVVRLGEDGIDLAIRYARAATLPPERQALFAEAIFPAAAPALLANFPEGLSATSLPRLTLLNYEDHSRDPWMDWPTWLEHLGLTGSKPKAILRFNHYDQLIAAAVAGQGIALGRDALVRQLIANGQLTALPGIARHPCERAYFLLGDSNHSARPEIGIVREWLLRQAQSHTTAV